MRNLLTVYYKCHQCYHLHGWVVHKVIYKGKPELL